MDEPQEDRELVYFQAKGNVPPHVIEALSALLEPYVNKPSSALDRVNLKLRRSSAVNIQGNITWDTFKFYFFHNSDGVTGVSKYQQVLRAYNALGSHIKESHHSGGSCPCPLSGKFPENKPQGRRIKPIDVIIDPQSLLDAFESGDLDRLPQYDGGSGLLQPTDRSTPLLYTSAGGYLKEYMTDLATEMGRSLTRSL